MSDFEEKATVPIILVAGRDYPRTYREFVEMFPDDEACSAYLEQLRWPEGFICPSCGKLGNLWRESRGRLACSSCRHQASITSGTILDKTRTPLTTWFEAAWHVTTAKNGLSAKTLERTLGTRYRVAWTILQDPENKQKLTFETNVPEEDSWSTYQDTEDKQENTLDVPDYGNVLDGFNPLN